MLLLTEDCCMLDNVPESVKMYFDYKAFARVLLSMITTSIAVSPSAAFLRWNVSDRHSSKIKP